MQRANKMKRMLKIFQMLYNGEKLYASNKEQQYILDLDSRSYNRYLDDAIEDFEEYMIINKTEEKINGKSVKVYKKFKINEAMGKLLKFFLEEKDDNIIRLFPLIYEDDPNTLKKYNEEDRNDIEKIIKRDEGVILFRTNPYEDIVKDIGDFFSLLKRAVKEHEYLDIKYKYKDMIYYKAIKPLKLIFSEDNWYLAIEYNSKLILLRVNFIQYAKRSRDKNRFQSNVLSKYANYFENMQNSMSLQGVEEETAVLRATKKISMYFKKGMKKFFNSQKFIGEDEGGRITFEISYTQPLEILPFIKKWLPDIEIISPKSLKDVFRKDLESALKKVKK